MCPSNFFFPLACFYSAGRIYCCWNSPFQGRGQNPHLFIWAMWTQIWAFTRELIIFVLSCRTNIMFSGSGPSLQVKMFWWLGRPKYFEVNFQKEFISVICYWWCILTVPQMQMLSDGSVCLIFSQALLLVVLAQYSVNSTVLFLWPVGVWKLRSPN